jgi:aminoglycoside/choline kinase family phosphotransferase
MTQSLRSPNDPRLPQLIQFIAQHHPDHATPPKLASADASARRYWRVRLADGSTRIIMDAPPPNENIGPFLAIQARLAAANAPVPAVGAFDEAQGFLVLEDLGDCTLYQWRHGHSINAVHSKLEQAVALLPNIARTPTQGLAAFDAAKLNAEMDLFTEWYAARHLNQPMSEPQYQLWQDLRDTISARLIAMPQVFVHRDYHSRNLMVREADPERSLVVIDFQDAVQGPLAYDLVSLLRDSYIDWPDSQVDALKQMFWHSLPPEWQENQNFAQFNQDFNWVAVQRHLKVLGIFARLSIRDDKHGYLKDLPLTWKHLQRALAGLPELSPLAALLAPYAPTPSPALPQ